MVENALAAVKRPEEGVGTLWHQREWLGACKHARHAAVDEGGRADGGDRDTEWGRGADGPLARAARRAARRDDPARAHVGAQRGGRGERASGFPTRAGDAARGARCPQRRRPPGARRACRRGSGDRGVGGARPLGLRHLDRGSPRARATAQRRAPAPRRPKTWSTWPPSRSVSSCRPTSRRRAEAGSRRSIRTGDRRLHAWVASSSRLEA